MAKKKVDSSVETSQPNWFSEAGSDLATWGGATLDYAKNSFVNGSVSGQTTWDQIPTGRRFDLSYEPQVGQPIDGGSELLRKFAPFTIAFELPKDVQDYLNQGQFLMAPSNDEGESTLEGSFSFEGALSSMIGTDVAYADAFLQDSLFQSTTAKPHSFLLGKTQIANYAVQLIRMAQIPELQVLVNPNSMAVSYTKVQDFSSRTRKNRIFRAWGEEQPNITFSFQTGGFIAGHQQHFWTPVGEGQTPSGLQYASKKLSAAWQNFMKIFQMYQNASLLYDTLHDTEAHLGVGGLVIKYDQMIYRGLIEGFDFSYNADSPNMLTFDLTLIVSEMEDVSDSSGSIAPLYNPNGGVR